MNVKERVVRELQKMGLSPREEEKGVVFSCEGIDFLYYDVEPENYLYFVTILSKVDDEPLVDTLKVVNSVNVRLKFGKLYISKGHVWAEYEYFMGDLDKLEFIVQNAIFILTDAKHYFEESKK